MPRAWLMGLLLVSAVSVAANPKATSLAKGAEQLYRDAKFDEAAEALQQAYDLEPKAQFLFNRARALEQAGRTEQAIEAYRKYTRLPADETDAALVLRAKSTIEQRTRPADPASHSTSKSPGLAATPTKGPAAKKSAREPEPALTEEHVAPLPPSGPSPKIPGLIVTGVAVAALGVGGTFGFLANGSRARFDAEQTFEAKSAAETATRQQALVADICLAAGVAATITAVILLIGSDRIDDAPVKVGLAPMREGGLVSVGLSF